MQCTCCGEPNMRSKGIAEITGIGKVETFICKDEKCKQIIFKMAPSIDDRERLRMEESKHVYKESKLYG